jgi:hypothetical protein
VIALAGCVLLGVVGIDVPVSAGASSPSAQSRSALPAGAPSVLSKLAFSKGGKLSPRLQLLAQPSSLKASAATQATIAGLPRSGPGSLLRAAGAKQLIVYARVSGSVASASEAIENAGATIVNSSARYGVLTVAVSPSHLQALGKLPGVASAWEALAPMYSATCPTGIISEGDSQLVAASARSTYAVDGSGVTVGILSDSFDDLGGASTGVSAGELSGTGNPCGYTTPLDVLAEDFTGTGLDEGRAMLEVVHDLAPGAGLAFATANGTDASPGIFGMADNIRALRDAGAKVIADDVTYFAEPMFQKGPIDEAIDDVTASGTSYFSSAGNENLIVGGHNVGSYEAPAYRPTPCPALVAGFGYSDCHDFDPTGGVDNAADYTLAAGGSLGIDLQWAEPWYGVDTDLDIFLIDAVTGNLLAYSDDSNPGTSGTQVPFEYTGTYVNGTGAAENVEVVIARWSGTARPRLKYVIAQGGGVTSVEYNSSSNGDIVGPTIFGHNGGQNTISMAAVRYSDATRPESYSSHGPVTYYYGPVSGTTPAAALTSPLVLSKPDLAATDCAQTSFFYQQVAGVWRFCGTSEAAPHAAAVAALMLDHDPALAPSQVLARLQSTAHAVTNGGTSDVVGSGLIDALAALGVSTPTFAFSQSSYSVSEAGPVATITINRSGSTLGAVSVHVATANGTATAGSDYTAVSEDVAFAAGETAKTISIPITDDLVTEGNETVSLSLSSPIGGELSWPSTATLTIVDNERSFALSSAGYSVSEGAGSVPITITRSGSTALADSVHFATANGTATAGSDYTAVSEDVAFAAGETAKTVSIPITDDGLLESSETVSLSISSPSSGATLGSPSAATLTIQDNDAALAFSAATYAAKESSGSATIRVNRTGYGASAVSVRFATANGTATAGSDYTTVNQVVSFAAGESSKTVTVPIANDASLEGNETVKLVLSSPSAGAVLVGPSAAILTIIDNPGRIASVKLTRKSFARAKARKVKLLVAFSPASRRFDYLLSFKKGAKWVTVRSVKKSGNFSALRRMTVKSLFGKKAAKAGRYRLKLTADANSRALTFRVT